MKVTEFARRLTLREGRRKSISIAQVLEVLRLADDMLLGGLYRQIRDLRQESKRIG